MRSLSKCSRAGTPPFTLWCLVLLAVLAGAARAQAPPPSPAPSPSPAAPAATPPPAPAPVPPAPEPPSECNPAQQVCITIIADVQERLGLGHLRATGFADLRFGESRIQAEELNLYEGQNPDGSVSQRIEAVGNVVFLSGEERMAGDRMTMDLVTGRGNFENALGFMNPDLFVEASNIERVDADTFRIKNGKFTSCSQVRPRWSFSAKSATLDVDKKITATNVLFKVKDVPALYIPWFTYPLEEDQRSTGFLFPHIGRSSTKGRQIGGGFFWAMNRSFDQTFYVDSYSEYGWGYGHEFRYRLKQPSRADFRTYLFRRSFEIQRPVWEHDLDWSAVQMLPGRVRTSLRVREASRIEFREQFQQDLDLALYRQRTSSANLQRAFGPVNVNLYADSTDTFFESEESFDRRRHLPTLETTLAPRKHKGTGLVFGLGAKGENLTFGNQDRVDTYGRYDLFPRLSRPFNLSFLQVTPEVAYRSTWYGVSDVDLDQSSYDLSGGPLQRRYLQSSVAVAGPAFARVFDTPGNFYSEKYKHVIGPEVTWTFRPRVENFESYPFFDQDDRIPATNEVSYALVQRFSAKRLGTSGKPETYEFLSLRVGQTYYVKAAASGFDPSYASSPYLAPGGVPSHYSPIRSHLRFRPTRRFTSNFIVEYDINFDKLKSLNLNTSAEYERLRFDASWFRGNRLNVAAGGRRVAQDTIRGSARVALLPRVLTADGRADYDFIEGRLIQAAAGLRYDVQCCGFRVDVVRTNYSGVPETTFGFSISLAHIGSISPLNSLNAAQERRY